MKTEEKLSLSVHISNLAFWYALIAAVSFGAGMTLVICTNHYWKEVPVLSANVILSVIASLAILFIFFLLMFAKTMICFHLQLKEEMKNLRIEMIVKALEAK